MSTTIRNLYLHLVRQPSLPLHLPHATPSHTVARAFLASRYLAPVPDTHFHHPRLTVVTMPDRRLQNLNVKHLKEDL